MTDGSKFLIQTCAILAVAFLFPMPGLFAEPSGKQLAQKLQDEWADIFYRLPEEQQAEKFKALLPRVHGLVERYPHAAEPLIVEALVLSSYAAVEPIFYSFSKLEKVKKAKDSLDKSIKLDRMAMEASALVTLGNLYYRLPGPPISYGDDDEARRHLEDALHLYPDALHTNYAYGDFLIRQGEFSKALPYLEKAEQAPVRPHSRLADNKLKEELKQAFLDARNKSKERDDFLSKLLPFLKHRP
jgi:tetratricopeptide (TPR) repeat protein